MSTNSIGFDDSQQLLDDDVASILDEPQTISGLLRDAYVAVEGAMTRRAVGMDNEHVLHYVERAITKLEAVAMELADE